MEKRFTAVEVRAIKSGNKRTIGGYAARYGVLSADLGGFRERIERGAFKRILATNPDVVCLFNHKDDAVLGRTASDTLRLCEDATGLAFECDLPDTQAGRDTYESVQRGDLNGCSFAFMVDDQRMCSYENEEIEDEEDDSLRWKAKRKIRSIVRSIRDFANLVDVSVVTHPAYPSTSVGVRSLVAAEVRSRVQAMMPKQQFISVEEMGKGMQGPSFEDRTPVRNERRRRVLLEFNSL